MCLGAWAATVFEGMRREREASFETVPGEVDGARRRSTDASPHAWSSDTSTRQTTRMAALLVIFPDFFLCGCHRGGWDAVFDGLSYIESDSRRK